MSKVDLVTQRNNLPPEVSVKNEDISPIGELAVYYKNNSKIRALLQLIPSWSVADTLLQQRADEIKRERMRTLSDTGDF